MTDNVKEAIMTIEVLKSERRFDRALVDLQNLLLKYPDDYRIYEEIADVYIYLGKKSNALKAINYALHLHSESSTGNYLKGFILLSTNKPYEALEYLEKSNKLTCNNSEVLRNLGWAYTLVGQQERGIMILKRALNISPGDELITEDLAVALIGIGKIADGNDLLSSIGKKKLKF